MTKANRAALHPASAFRIRIERVERPRWADFVEKLGGSTSDVIQGGIEENVHLPMPA
jgi:hypothetical protein